MKISLFLPNKVETFFLPSQVSGSYSFDEFKDEESKLINIEARDGKWILSSTETVQVAQGNMFLDETPLEENQFYLLKRDEKFHLMLTSPLYEEGYQIYAYNNRLNLVIGNDNQCNITYPCEYLYELLVNITVDNGQIQLSHNNKMYVYVNGEAIGSSNINLKIGDIVNIIGLKIMILNNVIIINNPYQGITINGATSGVQAFSYTQDECISFEVKDIDLYDKKDFFSKSPRIKRNIETKKIRIDAPPRENNNKENPLLLTLGPMLTLAATSGMTLVNTVTQITNGTTTLSRSWPSLVTGCLTLCTSLVWPLLTRLYTKKMTKKRNQELREKYSIYLAEKEKELEKELIMQRNILDENLISSTNCLQIINTRKNNFWCKRAEQNDFLEVRVGIGNVPLKVDIQWPEEGFTIEENELKKQADATIEKYKYIENAPFGYSLYKNFLTAVMGVRKKSYGFVNNILLQLMTFYCYDELKIILFTDKENEHKWDYLKYSNYCFNDDKTIRFIATDIDEAKDLGLYLSEELNWRMQQKEKQIRRPHYIVLCDNYTKYKGIDFLKKVTELDQNNGYSTIIIENILSKLPSKCINFINLNEGTSGILKNSYENAEITNFHDEIDYNINMSDITKILSNIPIELEGKAGKLPEQIAFLEMEKVGKVEQLNILNRWNTNDSTKSLKAEVGVDEEGNFMYLDLHEKFHGPHGLIAGMTGSGKSEFIITYILSMAMNYSPDDVAFILIDYKGGGLAFAFENKSNGIKLPHLAGTITNLDKAEMNRTLQSIDSEVKRRQEMFNIARDNLGESTIDIYKYQKYYHEGKLSEPIPHLFIISDEFAELKSQQPDFMDNLISVARIGRSLGVHLILATQKPSGVVNDQIWSNTKFRVCLKVQDASDSNEMLKRPDAASLKQTGRFYLQVGYDEYFALGQSGWAGSKYYPSDKAQKQVDKSINFINNYGQVIKSATADNGQAKRNAEGEQLAAVLNEIINVAKETNKYAKTLWLENIPDLILLENTIEKYHEQFTPYNVKAVIGEYDAPELQKQGIVTYKPIPDGNLAIYGNDGSEREQVLNAIMYSIAKNHTSEEVNFYTIDFGSESLRVFSSLPHVGGMVFIGENEKYTNLIKLIRTTIQERKNLFVEYGGEYENYLKNSGKKLPLKVVIINNYDAAKENISTLYEEIPELIRDSDRYGVIFIMTANNSNSLSSKITQNCSSALALHLKDSYDYASALNVKCKHTPQDTPGRGICNINGAHEFQTVSLVENEADLSGFITDFVNAEKEKSQPKAQRIPSLPPHVEIDDVSEKISTIKSVPIGISKENLDVMTLDFLSEIGKIITANKFENTKNFTNSLLEVLRNIKNQGIILIDAQNTLSHKEKKVSNYYNKDFDNVMEQLNNYVDTQMVKPDAPSNVTIFINGLDKLVTKLANRSKMEDLFGKLRRFEKIGVIVVDEVSKLKQFAFDNWFKDTFSQDEGLWIGTGLSEQTLLKISSYAKEYKLPYKNDMGFLVADGGATLCKLLDFQSERNDTNEQ